MKRILCFLALVGSGCESNGSGEMLRIHKSEYAERWPLVVDYVEVDCGNLPIVVVAGGKRYSLINGDELDAVSDDKLPPTLLQTLVEEVEPGARDVTRAFLLGSYIKRRCSNIE